MTLTELPRTRLWRLRSGRLILSTSRYRYSLSRGPAPGPQAEGNCWKTNHHHRLSCIIWGSGRCSARSLWDPRLVACEISDFCILFWSWATQSLVTRLGGHWGGHPDRDSSPKRRRHDAFAAVDESSIPNSALVVNSYFVLLSLTT